MTLQFVNPTTPARILGEVLQASVASCKLTLGDNHSGERNISRVRYFLKPVVEAMCDTESWNSDGEHITSDDERMADDLAADWNEAEHLPEPPADLDTHAKHPESDKQAVEALHRVAGSEWVTVNGDIYVCRCGLWTQDESAFFDLLMRHSSELGAYGESVPKMRYLMALAKTKNIVDITWTQQLDRLAAGLVPFANGIFDVATRKLREITPHDMITKKFDINAPSETDDDLSPEIERLWCVLADLLPDRKLKDEVMVRLAESFFSPTNTHKYFVQLYGEGNNGKTTLFRMLITAFPQWVQMQNVEHLVVKGIPRDPNSPQPWLIDVMGARILAVEEPSERRAFDGSLLKLLRGNGVVTGRQLHKNNVSYIPTFTLWIAANSPIEIKPTDRAVIDSLHPFKLPSYFSDGVAPLGTRFPRQKISNLEEWFTDRKYKLALFNILCHYYAIYKRNGLPPLESEFAMKRLYQEEHPCILHYVESCFELRENSKLPAKCVYEALKAAGCKESPKKIRLVMEEHFKENKFVKLYQPRNLLTWSGLSIVDNPVEHLSDL